MESKGLEDFHFYSSALFFTGLFLAFPTLTKVLALYRALAVTLQANITEPSVLLERFAKRFSSELNNRRDGFIIGVMAFS